MEFLYPSGHPMFTATIPGYDPLTMFTATIPGYDPLVQREFCEVLTRVRRFYVFIATDKFNLINVKDLTWNPHEHKEIFDELGK